jgi:hypothetical protein
MSQKFKSSIAVVGIDIGKNWFHIVGHNQAGAIVLRQKWSRGQVEARLANLPPCLIGMEACVGGLGRVGQGRTKALGALWAQVVDRGGEEATAPQRPCHRARQQARPHCLEGPGS